MPWFEERAAMKERAAELRAEGKKDGADGSASAPAITTLVPHL
jgi:hypothetical protein